MNLNPFIEVISSILNFVRLSLIIYIVMEWLISFGIINPYQPLVYRIKSFFNQFFEPMLGSIRKYLPPIAGIDLSPLVLFLLINLTNSIMFNYLYKY